jgi:hypothetical protein
MKRLTKIVLKKNGVIKAIIDLDGKILTDDKKFKQYLMVIMQQDLVTQKSDGKSFSTGLEKITNEGQLIVHLYNELSDDGYEIA